MVSPFLADVVLKALDLVGAAEALADAEMPLELVLDVVAVAVVPRVDVAVLPEAVTTEVMVEPGAEVVLTAESDAVVLKVNVTPDTIKGAVSDKIAVGIALDIPIYASVECKKKLRAAEAAAEACARFTYVVKPIEVCITFPLVMTEATGNSIGNEVVAAPSPASVSDGVGGRNTKGSLMSPVAEVMVAALTVVGKVKV